MNEIVHSWDTGIKARENSDFSACIVAEYLPEKQLHYIKDCFRAQLEYPELKRQVVALAERDRPQAILIEDKASGQSLIQDLRRETSLPIIAVLPKGDKVTRFARVTPMIEAGKVALPREADWLSAFEQEVLGFPNAVHDDQVDALSQYLNWVREREWSGLSLRRL